MFKNQRYFNNIFQILYNVITEIFQIELKEKYGLLTFKPNVC